MFYLGAHVTHRTNDFGVGVIVDGIVARKKPRSYLIRWPSGLEDWYFQNDLRVVRS